MHSRPETSRVPVPDDMLELLISPHVSWTILILWTMRQLFAFALHATAAGIMAWGWFTMLEKSAMGEIVSSQKGGYLQFLTIQGLFFAWTYMIVSLCFDLLPSVTILRYLKTTLLMMSMPIAFVISTIYWTLLFFCPPLIITPGSELLLSIDLALHACPSLTLLIDFFVFETKFPNEYVYKAGPVALVTFSVWYASFVEYCATFNGVFPYPFLTYSSLPVRVLIYTAVTGTAMGCFTTLNALHAR